MDGHNFLHSELLPFEMPTNNYHPHQPCFGKPGGDVFSYDDFPPHFMAAPPFAGGGELNSPIIDQFLKEKFSHLTNAAPLMNPCLPALGSDPGFVERAAKFSSFGSRSLNSRANFNNNNNHEVQLRNNNVPVVGNAKLCRNFSSPSLRPENSGQQPTRMDVGPGNGSGLDGFGSRLSKLSGSGANSNWDEESTVSEQIPSGGDQNSRKRKKGKAKEIVSPTSTKVSETSEDGKAKRLKMTEENVQAKGCVKTEDESKGNSVGSGEDCHNQTKKNNSPKPPEPPKDYIHVRARRGQATDSHSLAERVRREKISERMKLLQDLVPGCNKVTGKALMLDEIINYVQSLQRQVEFLSMKLATVNPRLDIDMNSLLSKEINHSNVNFPQMYPLESSASAFYGHQPQQNPQLHTNIFSEAMSQCSVDPLPPNHGFTEGLPQFQTLSEDDLQSIVHQMGLIDGIDCDTAFDSQSYHAPSKNSQMKNEL